jgi:6-pyruvoyltetrahydropterin/6-carboxytetrahydropterin synthase
MHTVFKDFTFEACHSLPHLPKGHKCKRMHGHSYKVRVYATGPINSKTGFVVDYARLSQAWKPLYDAIDHGCLDDLMQPSTSENLAQWIFVRMKKKVKQVCRVVVNETATAGCEYSEDASSAIFPFYGFSRTICTCATVR